jgi:hypothetical protein
MALEGEGSPASTLQVGEMTGGMSRKSEEGCVRAAVLTGDGGDGGALIEFAKGETIAEAPNGLRASAGGGGSSRARWSEARRSGVEEIKGEEGGGVVRRPLEWQAMSGSARGEGEGFGAREVARGVREGCG